ncbi:uncharacterized protein LOC122377801 [Amphibalanus amphitrite]|uniref:uncharacterized protein LOC122377801 n=1 Tax=Amphibalanus amphitrite TaxID=1232801 RepID=UPI001C92289C|nr:uncharacterized protein LOC122377801 [Amphibalanus amphitrite]
MSGEDISNVGSSDQQTRLITLENPFKKPKKNKEDEEGDMNNIYATALLDKWMAQGKHENKAPAGKNTKQADAKSKKIGFLKQLLQGAKKQPTNAKEKVLHTLTEKKINLLIPQSLPDPRVIDPADQVPVVGVSPIDAVPDSEAGHSQGTDSRRIQEEFFASVDTYRTSIAHARQRVAHRQGQVATSEKTAPAHYVKQAAGTSTDPIEDTEKKPPKTGEGEEGEEADGVAEDMEVTLADILPDEEAARLEWRGSSSSEVTLVGSDGTVSRRRKSSLRRKKRASSAEKYQKWKRKTSTKAYVEYQRRTDPRFHVDEDQTSHSTSLSLLRVPRWEDGRHGATSALFRRPPSQVRTYPVSSTESTAVGGRASWSDISSVQTAPEPAPDGSSPGRVTRSTATEEQGRTEGTQTSSTEYLLLDRQSCLVKVLAALQRLNTDEALQVARILRRSLDEDRVYEDVNVKQILEPKRSSIDASNKPLTRVESEKVVAKGSPSRSGAIPEMISDQDYDELTRIVSQIDLMVRSKLRITAAPYSLIYETLINYHLEITQDYSPSVAVFNYYLTEQGHPLFDDTSGFFRPTILQVPRESLYPRLYAHRPYEEPRELPAGGRLLDLQLLLGELLICPFCGHDVVWGQHEMCVEFCCYSFAEVISREYEDDLGRIRRQAALRGRRAAIGELEEDSELLEAALSAAASDQQPPAKISCLVEKRTRLRALGRYGQDGTATGKAPHLLPFDMDMVKKASAAKAGEAKQSKHKSHRSRRKSSGPADEAGRRSATRRRSQRHASEPSKGSRTKRSSRLDGAAAGDESPPTGRRASRNKKRRTTRRDMMHEVEKLERKMGRRLTQDELEAVMEGDSVMQSDARGLSITAGGIEEKLDVTSMENIPDRGPSRRRSPRTSRDHIIDDTIGIRLSSYMKDTDDTTIADTESSAPPARRKGKERGGGPSRRSKKKRERERETEASTVDLESRDSKTKRAERAERDSVSPDDQLHYRLSESAFLEEGVTLLPWDGSDGDGGDPSQPQQQIITHPVELGQRQFLQERYPDGSLFVTWFDDGSGHVMYPSGEPAILITVEPAGRRFVVLPDQPCADLTSPNCVLAMFDPKGIGFVYSNKGAPRLLLDQREGWYHRDDGTVRRWHWSDLDDHVHHSPTLQPVIFAISRHVAIRVIRQDYIVLSFWANQRSARFNVGVTAEAATVTPVPGTAPLSPDQYRLVCQGTDQMELTELKGRVRRILAEMARITDEPVKYLIYHQKLLQRGLNVPLRRPVPQWLTAEPRQPRLPGGVSAALGRRSAAAAAVGNSARRAFLLQKMALLSHSEMTSAERRAGSAASQARSPSLQTLSQPAPLATIVPPPAEVT